MLYLFSSREFHHIYYFILAHCLLGTFVYFSPVKTFLVTAPLRLWQHYLHSQTTEAAQVSTD